MNSLEVFKKWKKQYAPDNEFNEYEGKVFEKVGKDLKLLNLLKEKKVDLSLISRFIYKYCYSVKQMCIEYPRYFKWEEGGNEYFFTEEEMKLIVDWLKENNND